MTETFPDKTLSEIAFYAQTSQNLLNLKADTSFSRAKHCYLINENILEDDVETKLWIDISNKLFQLDIEVSWENE